MKVAIAIGSMLVGLLVGLLVGKAQERAKGDAAARLAEASRKELGDLTVTTCQTSMAYVTVRMRQNRETGHPIEPWLADLDLRCSRFLQDFK